MDEIPLLHDIVVIFGLSIGVLLLMYRFHMPAIVGFLCTGVLCGPHALGLIRDEGDVQVLANIGIILLLFSVGMEFSFKKIAEYWSYFLIGGSLQVGLTVLGGMLVGFITGADLGEALFLGFLLSLSSTAIVLRLLSEKMENDTPYGRVIIGMMIFQDIIAIPMMLAVPLLGGVAKTFTMETFWVFIKGLGILGLVLLSADKIVPFLLWRIARTRSRELFLLAVFTICSSVAWLTSNMGLSLSLGAFLAGLIISESDYRNEALGDILPFQDIFTSFFFVSIGMLLNLNFFLEHPFTILAMTLGVIFLKAFCAGVSCLFLKMPLRTVILTALAMSQIGEFAFVIAKEGEAIRLGSEYHYQLFLVVALLSMAITPALMAAAPYLADQVLRLPLPAWLKSGLNPPEKKQHAFKEHTLIVGYGVSGQMLARSSKASNIPYVILEMNADTVRKEKKKGELIYFGDASHDSVLHHANIKEAKVVAILINDSEAVFRILETARKLNPKIHIIARTRYLADMERLLEKGADQVVADDLGASVEVFTRVLHAYEVGSEALEKVINDMKADFHGFDLKAALSKAPRHETSVS